MARFVFNLTRILIQYSVTPGPAMIRAVCEYSRLILITVVILFCPPTFSFGDAEVEL